MNIQRYKWQWSENEESDDGDFVLYSDHLAAMKEQEELLILSLAYNPIIDMKWLFKLILNDTYSHEQLIKDKKIEAREIIRGIE